MRQRSDRRVSPTSAADRSHVLPMICKGSRRGASDKCHGSVEAHIPVSAERARLQRNKKVGRQDASNFFPG